MLFDFRLGSDYSFSLFDTQRCRLVDGVHHVTLEDDRDIILGLLQGSVFGYVDYLMFLDYLQQIIFERFVDSVGDMDDLGDYEDDCFKILDSFNKVFVSRCHTGGVNAFNGVLEDMDLYLRDAFKKFMFSFDGSSVSFDRVLPNVVSVFKSWVFFRTGLSYKFNLGSIRLQFGRFNDFRLNDRSVCFDFNSDVFVGDGANLLIFDVNFSFSDMVRWGLGFDIESKYAGDIYQVLGGLVSKSDNSDILHPDFCYRVLDDRDVKGMYARGFRGNREVDSLIGDFGVGHLVLSKSEFGSGSSFWHRKPCGDLESIKSVSTRDSVLLVLRLLNAVGFFNYRDSVVVFDTSDGDMCDASFRDVLRKVVVGMKGMGVSGLDVLILE